MTKSQLVDCIAQRVPHLSRADLEASVQAVFDLMATALMRQQRIEVRGFGSFAVKVRPPREGRNPKTGEKVSVPARRTAYFSIGKELRERLNPGPSDIRDQSAQVEEATAVL